MFFFFLFESIITCLKSNGSTPGYRSNVPERDPRTRFNVYAGIPVLREQKHSHYSSDVIMSHSTFDPFANLLF